jgi:hypothetical protein
MVNITIKIQWHNLTIIVQLAISKLKYAIIRKDWRYKSSKSTDRQYKSQEKKYNNDLQNTTQKTKDQATRVLRTTRGVVN